METQSFKNESTSPPANVARYAWVILAVVFAASIVAPLNQYKVPPLLPVLIDAFELTLAQAGWLMSVFALTGMMLSLPAGILLHKIGLKNSGTIALVCLTLGSVLGALSGQTVTMLASRVIEGVGMGLISIVAPAAIAAWFPPSRQGMPMGIWATWVPVGTLLMYATAPNLAAAFGWKSVWWVNAIASTLILAFYLVLMRMPDQPAQKSEQTAAPVPFSRVLSNRNIWLLALQFCCFNLVFGGFGAYYPTFLAQERGYSLALAAMTVNIATFVEIFSLMIFGWAIGRKISMRAAISAPFLLGGLIMLFPFKIAGWQITAWMIAMGFIIGAVPTATFITTPRAVKRPELAGAGLAVVMFGQNLGMVIGPLYFGLMVERFSWVAAGLWLIPISLIGFFAAWRVKV